MSRIISAGSIVHSQVDFFQPSGSINRPTGITIGALELASFVNSDNTSFSLLDGTLVSDPDVSAGNVYFHAIDNSAYYSVRFFADRTGFWRIIIKNSSLQQERVLEFDVIPAGVFKSVPGGGLTASFS